MNEEAGRTRDNYQRRSRRRRVGDTATTTITTGSIQRCCHRQKCEAGGLTNGEQEEEEEASSVTSGHTEEVMEISSVSSSEADEQTTGPTIQLLFMWADDQTTRTVVDVTS